MSTTVYLSNPNIVINSVDLSNQCTAATITYTVEALENTAFGATARTYTAGLQNNSVTVTLFQSYAANETEVSVYSLVGTTTSIVIKPSSGAVSATNPSYTFAQTYLESHTPINASLGELSTIDLTFTGGTLTKATS